MNLTVDRQPAHQDAVMGRLRVNGQPQCYTLERASALIPAGVYVVTLTPSQRCCDGTLWSPDDNPAFRDTCGEWANSEHRLLLVNDVPARTGIRVHAANEVSEVDGCLAVGANMVGDRLTLSRLALVELMNLVVPRLLDGEAVTLEYRQAQ